MKCYYKTGESASHFVIKQHYMHYRQGARSRLLYHGLLEFSSTVFFFLTSNVLRPWHTKSDTGRVSAIPKKTIFSQEKSNNFAKAEKENAPLLNLT